MGVQVLSKWHSYLSHLRSDKMLHWKEKLEVIDDLEVGCVEGYFRSSGKVRGLVGSQRVDILIDQLKFQEPYIFFFSVSCCHYHIH